LLAAIAAATTGSIAMARYAPTKRQNLLKHTTRQQIIELVEKQPAVTKSDLRTTLDCSWSTIHHHIGLLVKEGLVTKAMKGRNARFFSPEMAKPQLESMLVLTQGRNMEFAQVVMDSPGLMQSEVAHTTGLSRKVLRTNIQLMTKAGLVVESRHKGCCRYHPTSRLATVMQRIKEDGVADRPSNGHGYSEDVAADGRRNADAFRPDGTSRGGNFR
jgi:predicted transcriptional regulator